MVDSNAAPSDTAPVLDYAPPPAGRWRMPPWLKRLLTLLIVLAIFAWMLKPVYFRWDQVRERILATNPLRFVGAAAMFAIFLFVFRVNSWRWILAGLGHRIPLAPATRIWSMSELARYLPGGIWQVVGRVVLARPYGVSASVCSASQILELTLFMLANVLVALGCFLFAGFRIVPPGQRHWLYVAIAFVPALLAVVHPSVFYSVLNFVLHRFKKAPITQRLPKRKLALLLLWYIVALLWQSLAVWLLTAPVLGLPIQKWHILAGSYCLAWTIGFSVGFMAPGGMGVREAVFITTMQLVLPPWVRERVGEPKLLAAFLGFLSVLLRLWAMSGELIMAGAAYLGDYRGAMGRADAPGRVRGSDGR